MSVEQFETEVLELAVRRVRTPEGSQFYNLPIGAPITADVIAAKEAEAAAKGLTPPTGALSSGSSKGQHMAGTIAGKADSEKKAQKPPAKPNLKIKIKQSSLKGNKHFSVGKAKYVAPNGSKLIRPTSQPGMAYVATPDGEVHAFNEAGEIEIPKTLKTVFENKFNSDFEGDENYAVKEFEASSASFDMSVLQPGAVLNDKRGTPQFKKLADDSWEHVDLGVKLKDADLQSLYYEGELLPDTGNEPDTKAAEDVFANVEAVNFAEMTVQEAQDALDALPPETKVTIGDKPFTKNAEGTFDGDDEGTGQGIHSNNLVMLKSILKVGTPAEPEYNPLDVETQNPLDGEKLIGLGDTPNDAWIDKALSGAQLTFTSPTGSKTIWTKQDDASWINQKGGIMSAPGMKVNYKVGGDNLKITREGKESDMSTQDTSEVKAPEPTQRSSSSLMPEEGDYVQESSPDEVANAAEGDKVLVSFDNGNMVSEYELNSNGAWENVDDPSESLGAITMKALAYNDGAEKVYKNQRNSVPQQPSSSSVSQPIEKKTSLDQWSNDEVKTWMSYVGLPDSPNGAAGQAWATQKMQGMDKGPDALPDADFDATEGEQLYRGVSDVSQKQSFIDGDSFVGTGGNGSGVYFSTDKGHAGTYGNFDDDHIIEAKIKPDANIVDGKELEAQRQADSDKHYKAGNLLAAQLASGDLNTYASAIGVDGYRVTLEGVPSVVIANKNALVVRAMDDQGGVSQNKKGKNNGAEGGEDGLAGGDAGTGRPGGVSEGVESVPGDSGPGDLGGDGGGVVLKSGYAPPLLNDGKPLEFDERTQALKDQGIVVAELYELDAKGGAYAAFYNSISKLKENNPYHASVYVYSEGEYGEMRLFLNADGTAGVALKGDEIVSVFVHPNSKDKGSARSLISQAVAQGGKRLDAYDTILPTLYAKEGFVAVARTPWNDEYAPEGWDKKTYAKYNNGAPDVVFMTYDPSAVDSEYDPNDGVVVSNYDDGVAIAKGEGLVNLPDEVPPGSFEIQTDSLDSVSNGSHVYEVTPGGNVLHYEKLGTDSWKVTLPSGLEMEIDKYTDILTGGHNKLYLAPSAEDLTPPAEELEEWEKALMEPFDSASPSGNVKLIPDSGGVGDVVHGVDGLDAQAPGTKLSYTKKDGTQSYYVKLDNGSWLTPGGGVMASVQLKGSANSGKFKIESLPDAPAMPNASVENEFGYDDGDSIMKMAHVNEFPVGQTLNVIDKGKVANTVLKTDEGWVAQDDGFFDKDESITAGEMGTLVTNGALKYISPQTTEAPSTDLDTQLWPGAPAMSEVQLTEAYKALEAHTSFHVSYGLKSLPDGHPLKDADNQEALKIAAVNKYSDLKAKPAVVKFLKDSVGIEESGSEDDAPKVWLGSRNPKEGVQGLDGGEFTTTEIQQAIDILEGFNGKLFKAELSKKGNPLGKLNPNDLVGFDKDKTVVKQKFIDLLKTKLIVTEENIKHPVVKDTDEFDGLAVGTQVSHILPGDGPQLYTKLNDSQWNWDNPSEMYAKSGGQTILPKESFYSLVNDGKFRIEKQPDVVPGYAKVPAAVQDKEVSEIDVENFGPDDVDSAELGTILEGVDDPNPIYLVKDMGHPDKPWTIVFHDGSQGELGLTDKEVKAVWGPWKLGLSQEDGPNFNQNSEDGIMPGKYATKTGKAYMVVNADGTGTYVNTKGDVKALTAEGVKSNYVAGMSQYNGLPDNVPTPTPSTPATKAKPKVVGSIEDGIYYAGKSSDPKTVVYEISGDSVKVYKPVTVPSYKVGQSPDSQWAEESSIGASFTTPSYYNYSVGKSMPGTTWTKGKDGLWSPEDGETQPTFYNETPGTHWGSKIKGHGLSTDPVTISKTKVNTLFSQGKLLDTNGNSVLPDGYSGSVHLFGSQTNIPALLGAQKLLDEKEFSSLQEFQNDLKAQNIYWSAKLVGDYTEKNFGEKNLENYVSAFKQAIGDLVSGIDTDIPESDASGLFEWNDMGEAKKPLEVASMEVYTYDVASTTAYIKAASKAIGEGKIIGQHYTKMDKYSKSKWVSAFNDGDFVSMYNLEVAAAAKEGKAHNAGYLHPGYPGNEGTNKIAWGAAVEGEISALSTVPGDWTPLGIQPSIEEVNNYLIKAQMQNPTYLTSAEKRTWVTRHKAQDKDHVDKLSASAALRKKNGESELSEPLVWSDDVKPAKVYDALFDDTEYPMTGWTNIASQAYLADHPENAELQEAYQQALHNGSYYASTNGVQAYFQAKYDEVEAQKLIPVYTLDPSQSVKKSTHPVFNYTDQFGKKYFFKPRPNTKLDKYRSEVEHLGNQFGQLFGFSTADSKLIELDGKYGQLQSDLGGVSDLMGFDYSTLTPVQIADIGNEHMLDWFLDNDDTKGDNAKILPNGRIVGIDKGRALKHFGAWQGLSGDSSMNSNANTIYSQLFDAIRGGKMKKEDVDAAYLAIQKKAEKMAKVSDSRIEAMLAEGMVNREQWDISYSIDGKPVSKNLAGLTSAVLDRKNRLPEQIEEMWSKVYKQAGYGDLPEKPNNPLGDVISGLDDDRLHTEVFQAEAPGKTAMIGGSHVIGGTVLLWTDQNSDGTTNMNGEMFLGPKKQKELLDYFLSNSSDMTSSEAVTAGFGTYDKYGDDIIGGAKTINHHAGDLNYNEEKVKAFQSAKSNVESDLDEWKPGMESNAETAGEDAYKFKSGTIVPMQYLSQYKMMLDHYGLHTSKIQAAYETHGKTDVVSKFSPLVLSKDGEKFVHSDGSSLTKLGSGAYLYVDGETGTVSTLKDGDANWYYVEDAVGGTGLWVPVVPEPGEKPTSGVTIVKRAKVHDQTAKVKGHTKVLTGTGNVSGANGQEYEVTLPTGEKIYFRNADQTNTKRGQHGKLSFRAEGVGISEDSKAAIDRISQQLNAMGVSTDAAEYEHAELTYWREMYGILENRKHTAGSKYAKAYAKMQVKVKEIGGNENEFLENLSEKLDANTEIEFWRGLYSEFWPDEVSNLIATEGYLPKFDHQNLNHPELETGKPYWERFDISLDDIYGTNKVLASSTGSDPLQLVLTGGGLSAEERLRQADYFIVGGSWSPQSDQTYGSSHNIYTRVVTIDTTKNYNAIYNPKAMLRTRTYSFNSDSSGKLDSRKNGSPSDPIEVLNKFTGGSNETMLPHMATMLDLVEVYGFDYAEKRNEAIQHLKKLGIEKIRGVPIEDRLVMRSEMNAAVDKMKKVWAEKVMA